MADQPEALRLADWLEYGCSQQTADAITKERDALRAERDALRTALDAALEFAGVVAGGASWWDDVWPEHEAAIAKAKGGGNG